MKSDIFLFFTNCWVVLGQMSPYLLLGFIISGVLSVFISPEWIEKHLGGGKFASILKATLFGIPLPLCSCGVIPVAASLRKHGASKAATTSFLLSTPQTGIDSIFATWGLLGGVFAVFRPLAALVTGLIGGLMVSFVDNGEDSKEEPQPTESNSTSAVNPSLREKFITALKYGLITLPGEIAKALIIGIIIAGLISTFVASNALNQYLTNYYLTLFLMLAIGIPLYVCSTSSIPIALGFIHLGVSPGAALVFLISGPATNAAAISVIWKILGKRSAIIYILTVVVGSIGSGIAFDAFNQSFSMGATSQMSHGAHSGIGLIGHISAIFMVIVLVYSWYKVQYQSQSSCCSSCSAANKENLTEKSNTFSLKIEGMSCNNCVKAVSRIILEIPGVISTTVSLQDKNAVVKASFSDGAVIANAVNELGFEAELLQEKGSIS